MLTRLTSLAVLIYRLSAAAVPCRGGVFCVQDIDVDLCGRKDTDVCTTLVLYNSTGHKVQLQGSGNIEGPTGLGLKNISRAEQVGTSGCYTLFKKKNQGNEQYQIKDIGTIHNLGKPRVFRCVIMRHQLHHPNPNPHSNQVDQILILTQIRSIKS